MEDLLRKGLLSSLYAEEKPNAIAVTDAYDARTFEQLHQNANRLANALVARGLGKGDAIALLCSNRIEFVEVFMASMRIGLRLTPVNWHLSEAEAAYIISDCEATALIAEARFLANTDYASLSLKAMISIAGESEGFEDYKTVLAGASADDPERPVHGNVMLYTSGTTGRPKGVFRKHPSIVPPQLSGTLADYDPNEDAQLLCGPAYHAAPLVFDIAMPLSSGVPIHLLEAWDSQLVLRLIEDKKITHAHMVPIMFQRLLALPKAQRHAANVQSLKKIFHGAAPCAPDVKRAMIDWFGPVLNEYYAGSEGGAGFNITSEEWLRKPGSVGRVPFPGAVRLLDASGDEVGVGEDGEVYHRADPHNPFTYYKAPEKTNNQSRDGYFTLGDIGRIDEDGYLFLTGRSAECIISGGVNIYPREIDEVISAHEAVADVCTIGAPNDEWGEEVRAVVQLKDSWPKDEALASEILTYAKRTLSGFKAPRQIDFVDELPRLPSGKIPRERVRAPYWEGRAKKI